MRYLVMQDLAWQKKAKAAGDGCYIDDNVNAPETGLFLDDFEQRLQRKGQVLIALTGRCLMLDGQHMAVYPQRKIPVFADDADDDLLHAMLRKRLDVRKLHVMAELPVVEGKAVLRDDERKALARLDVVSIGGKTLLSIDALRGYETETDRFVDALWQAGAESSDAGLVGFIKDAIAVPLKPYSLKPAYGLAPDMATADAVAGMTATMLDIARQNEDGMVNHADDIEYLHHYRVCLRKVRSLVSLLKDNWPEDQQQDLKARLGDLARRTNELRDLDVWMDDKDYYESLLPDSLRAGLPVMFGHFARRHKAARNRVARWVTSPGYDKEIMALQAALADTGNSGKTEAGQKPVLALVQKKIRKRYAKICSLGLAITPETPDDDVHELRIEGKKLRYLLEFFAELLDRDMHKAFLKKMKRLQDNLGLFNDYSVQQEDLLAFDRKHGDDVMIARTVGALVTELARRQTEQRRLVEENFAAFADADSAMMIDILTGKTVKEEMQ